MPSERGAGSRAIAPGPVYPQLSPDRGIVAPTRQSSTTLEVPMGKRRILALVLLAALLLILAGSGCMESDAMREAQENVELGDAAYKEGDLPKAVQAYRQATARAPGTFLRG